MRIAVLAGIFPSWSTTFIIDQITAAIDQGHEVHIYATSPGTARVEHAEVQRYRLKEKTRYLRFHHRGRSQRARSLALWQTLLRHPRLTLKTLRHVQRREQLEASAAFLPGQQYDVIHCHFATSAKRILPVLNSGLLQGNLLVTFHGYDILRGQRGEYDALFARQCLYTVNTEFLKQRAVALGCPAERIVTLPMGVKTSLFDEVAAPRGPSGSGQRSLPRSTGDELRVLTVARLVPFKGVEFGLRAFASVLKVYPRAIYEICGDGPLRASLEALARELGVSRRVLFHGAQQRQAVVAALQRADVFLMPGIVDEMGQCEAQGVVLLEAQACRVPVVASRIGGMPEVLDEGRSAYLVEPRNVGETARRVIELLGDRELRQRFGDAGRSWVRAHFEQEDLNRRLFQLYEGLATGDGLAVAAAPPLSQAQPNQA